MDRHINEYYQKSSDEGPHGNFHQSIALHEAPDIDWSEISVNVPILPKGWYELSQLKTKDRIEFTHDFWQAKLPYRNKFTQFIDSFFDSLDDIGIFLTQQHFDSPFEVEMVYSLKGSEGFYRGKPPIISGHLEQLNASFPNTTFPFDYIAFLKIHDGFCKTTDSTGITSSVDMVPLYQSVLQLTEGNDIQITGRDTIIDPKCLIPFYESFGMPFYQCFYSEWYPEQEMGNVYYSAQSHTISDFLSKRESSATLAFPTFLDWLWFYLERVE